MTFDAYDLSLIRSLVPLLDRLGTIDPKPADQLRRRIGAEARTAAIASSGASPRLRR